MDSIYLDYNATTPVDKEVADEMRPFLDEYFGNPSSIHSYGIATKLAVEKARSRVADLIGCSPSELVFTSGGTESNNMAIKGVALAASEKGKHLITSSVEHPAVFEVFRYLEKLGFQISYLPVDKYGLVSPDDLKRMIRKDTILVSVMHANNEVGTIQPIEELAAIAHERDIVFHSDAAQSAGKIITKVDTLGVDMLSLAGHKLYAPKGIGALYIREGIVLEKFMHGADHEQNMRAGTENVLEIVGFGKACEIAARDIEKNIKHYAATRDLLEKELRAALPSVRINGHPDKRLPNTLSVSFPGAEANTLVARLENVAASAGAACHAESIDVSVVLQAMKVPVEYAMGTIRFSTGRATTTDNIKMAAGEIIPVAVSLMPSMKGDSTAAAKKKDSSGIKLTMYTHGLGCACKIEPRKLESVLQGIPFMPDPNVLVGTETSDDAAVYRINDETALVQTLDFFTPIVDDPYHFGAIAAANALSDIYAMGASPLFGLNIVGFPEDTLPMDVLGKILEGASDKAREAGINILGGHTIEDPEPKYGMVVSGIIHPEKIIKNHGALAGDLLILTKPLGSGIMSTAMKRGLLSEEESTRLIEIMSCLNRQAAELMVQYRTHASTDITGFGLLGHLREMTRASGINAEIDFEKIPFIERAKNLATAGIVPGGTFNNLDWVKDDVDFGKHTRTNQLLLCDAQTSGGLLISVHREDAEELLGKLLEKGISESTIIGRISSKGNGKITIV